ncbi:MAG TPA: NifU family protein [Saprospiraceae bacterium]|nr:NifU family protein [Saprospiraceae bacterium]
MSLSERPELLEKIEKAIDTVRPHLIADGGNVEVVELREDKVLVVRYTGACQSCHMSEMTLRAGISRAVMANVPEVLKVIAYTSDLHG